MSRAAYRSMLCYGLAVAVTVTGCEKKPEKPVMVMSAVRVSARPVQVLPARQAGLWETAVREEGSEDVQALQICIDGVTDARLSLRGSDFSGDGCGPKTISRVDEDSWKVMTTCHAVGGGMDAYSGTFTGDFSTSYDMTLRVQTTGATLPQMNRTVNYVIESKRIGDCRPGQAPGDVTNDGVTINLFEMEGRAAPKPSSSSGSDMADYKAGD